MKGQTADAVSRQVEFAIGKFEGFTLPRFVTAALYERLLAEDFSAELLGELIETEPALAMESLRFLRARQIEIADEGFSVAHAIGRLRADELREFFLSFGVDRGKQKEPGADMDVSRQELTKHSVAVGCCAKQIVKLSGGVVNLRCAYLAGLVHDIGKFVFADIMPKSFEKIVSEAKNQRMCICDIERMHLGIDHTIAGRRIARRWHLPEQLCLGIWLHHSDAVRVSKNISAAKTAVIVRLADLTARAWGIGQSGSFDEDNSAGQIAEAIGIDFQVLEQQRSTVIEEVEKKCGLLGFDKGRDDRYLCETLRQAVARFNADNVKLRQQTGLAQSAVSHLEFITALFGSIDLDAAAIDFAEDFAVRWQRFYQTGRVCLYLLPPDESREAEVVLVESLGQSKRLLLKLPSDKPPIPQSMASDFKILDARDNFGWLLEQTGADFDSGQTRAAALLSGSRVVGAIIFELRYPADISLFEKNYKCISQTAGAVLDMLCAGSEGYGLAESFVSALSRKTAGPQQKNFSEQRSSAGSINALAEMAAGAAHELNNPLAVISGQAQLLAAGESDSDRKTPLQTIERNCRQISEIINALLSFAEPQQPRPDKTNIKQIIDEAAELAALKANIGELDLEMNIAADTAELYVDSAQTATAIANVFSNCVESYGNRGGPIKVSVSREAKESVMVEIKDFGCGMDADTLAKAVVPFFSAGPAGRRRGLGLSYAVRLIELNSGSLNITSQPGEGTTVTILLPCKEAG